MPVLKIECLRDAWIRNGLGGKWSTMFFTGIRISEGNKVALYPYPFTITIQDRQLRAYNPNGREDVWLLTNATLSNREIMDLISNCSCCSAIVVPLHAQYDVASGSPQRRFAIPIPDDTVLVDEKKIQVYIDGSHRRNGTGEFQWVLDNGDILFDQDIVVPIGQPPTLIDIYYGYTFV